MINRKTFSIELGTSFLATCSSGKAPGTSTPGQMGAVPDAVWDAWVAGFKGRAASQGISRTTINRTFKGGSQSA